MAPSNPHWLVPLLLLAPAAHAADPPAPPIPPAGMVLVPAAEFTMGRGDGEPDERPPFRARLRAFFIDRDEVTIAAYRRCVDAGRCQPPRRAPDAGDDDRPVTWVSHRDADAYCRFADKALPTEAQWELAARGTDGRTYPWGDPPPEKGASLPLHQPVPPGLAWDDADCARANVGNYRGEGRCPDNPGRPVSVGGREAGAAPSGARDLAGNVMEWTADVYSEGTYADHARRGGEGAIDEPTGPKRDPRDRRALRGGGCCSTFGLPRTTDRIGFPAGYSDEDIGFRCARAAPDPRPPRRAAPRRR